ncbi:MAG: hypothetical protein JWN66_3919 [Sphingomonas bacterium]|jgi:hypothetical protein|uniref:hypothetical protein n=1 Tax=Sphingomonas bacterium TaxID=1895847 RepID=UPI00261230AE|nr:hypothetical protein [Sphingomonas bacterium]MDB5706803.1 hypothetical protein [Sphingomonas bacterium]
MADSITDPPETSGRRRGNAAPVVITFALLFLLAASVWFILDRIRTDELRAIETAQSAHGQARNAQAPSPVARK